MASGSDRARRIRRQVAEVLATPHPDADPANPFHAALAEATIPEVFGLLIAQCRSEDKDEVENIEVLIRALPDVTKEELLGWDATLQPLGYARVSGLLRRMARHAPSKPPMTIFERVRARQAARSACKKQQN